MFLCKYGEGDDYRWQECDKKKVCSKEFKSLKEAKYVINFKSQRSIHNWVEQYNLECASNWDISLIGSSFFVGCFFGSLFLSRLADIYGRKPLFILGLLLYLIVVIGVLISTNYYVLLVFMGLGGVSEVARYYVAYVYAIEILPRRFSNSGGQIIFMSFSATKIFICIYFMASPVKEWKYLGGLSIVYALASLYMTVRTLKESPRFLYDKGEKAKTIEILQYI